MIQVTIVEPYKLSDIHSLYALESALYQSANFHTAISEAQKYRVPLSWLKLLERIELERHDGKLPIMISLSHLWCLTLFHNNLTFSSFFFCCCLQVEDFITFQGANGTRVRVSEWRRYEGCSQLYSLTRHYSLLRRRASVVRLCVFTSTVGRECNQDHHSP
jgi:hypothetical protein